MTITGDGITPADTSALTVTTLRWGQNQRRFEGTDDARAVESSRKWKADLPPGSDHLELTGNDGEIVSFCRSPKMLITDKPTAWPVMLQNIRAVFVDRGDPLGLRHLAIRSLATTDDTIVHDSEPIE